MQTRKLNWGTRWVARAALLFMFISATANAQNSDAGETAPGKAPTSAEIRDACNYVAKRGPAIRGELLHDAVLDVRNDGQLVYATIGMDSGSASGEILEFRPRDLPKNAPSIETSFFDDRSWGDRGFGARWLRYKGHVYAVVFESENLRHAKHLGLIDEKNREHLVCTFTAPEHETLLPMDDGAKSLCRAVASGHVSYLPLNTNSTATVSYAGGPRIGTFVEGASIADFTNSGAADKLAELEYSNSGGRGGGAKYYDIVVNGKEAWLRKHELLMALQHVRESPGRPDDLLQPSFAHDNISRLFSYRGLTYIDITATGGNAYNAVPFHEVRLLHGDRITTECAATFHVSWKLSEIAGEYR